jgi:hypothetical protein
MSEQIRVAELIAQLQECPPDALVCVETIDDRYSIENDECLSVWTFTVAPWPSVIQKRTYVTLRVECAPRDLVAWA